MTTPRTLSELYSTYRKELQDVYSPNEIRNIGFLVAEHLLNYSKIDLHLKDNELFSEETGKKSMQILDRLRNGEPVQYVTGKTEFYGLPIRVDKRVLIPRPETEELTDWIIRENKQRPVHILDLGTGSGCIAISLAKNLPDAGISACDISEDALELAKANAGDNGTDVQFFKMDLLEGRSCLPRSYEVMVSNPPYVTEKDKSHMRRNVLEYEPQLALFVPDHDPLIFYRNIALLGRKYLQDGGKLYLEINERFPDEIARLLKYSGYFGVEVRKDINGRFRMVRGSK